MTTAYYQLGTQKVALRQVQEDGSSQVFYTIGDHLGSTSLTTNHQGQKVSHRRYYPYGEVRVSSGEAKSEFGFTGQREEASFGLMDYNARYYSPVLGRFVSPDSIVPGISQMTANFEQFTQNEQKSIDVSSGIVLNRYAYVGNNPLKSTDPDGHCYPLCTIAIGASIGAIAGGVAYAANVVRSGETFDRTEAMAAIGGGAVAGGLVGSGVGVVAAGGTGAALSTGATLSGAGIGMAGAGGGYMGVNMVNGNDFNTKDFAVISAYGGVAGALTPHYGTSIWGTMNINGLANVATYETIHLLDAGSMALDTGTVWALGTGMAAGKIGGAGTTPKNITTHGELLGVGYMYPDYVASELLDATIGGSNLLRVSTGGHTANAPCPICERKDDRNKTW